MGTPTNKESICERCKKPTKNGIELEHGKPLAITKQARIISIEAWHDGIHMLLGTGHGGPSGDMAKAEVAAVSFSPHSFELSVDILGSSNSSFGCIIGESCLSNLRYEELTAAK